MAKLDLLEKKSIIGMIHTLALPGTMDYCGDMTKVIDRALADLHAMQNAGVDAVIVENFCDHPAGTKLEPEQMAALTHRLDELLEQFPDIQIVFIESGGDNLSATFSPELADATIFVIDVAEGDKIPRKGGPGITRSDLLIINKIDLAEMVGASLEIMDRDSRRMRGNRPFLFTNIRGDSGVDRVVEWIKKSVLFEENV